MISMPETLVAPVRIGTERVERERGYLYYLGIDGYVHRVGTASSGVNGWDERAGKERIPRLGGCMYFLDKNGYIAAVPMADRPGRETRVAKLRIQQKTQVEAQLRKISSQLPHMRREELETAGERIATLAKFAPA